MLDRFLPRAPDTALELDDYPRPIAEAARCAARLLAAALRRGAAGINLLIHGPTGSGKTELARVLAREAQAALFVAGKEDDEGLPPDARERLAALRLGHRVLAGGRAVIAFDELEDLFVRDNAAHSSAGEGRDAARMSKLWFNQLLETAPVPTIWMANNVAGMDPAFLRRFALALELPWPAPSQRKRLWRGHLGHDLPLGDAELDDLAERFAVSPGQIETATRAARLLGETRDLYGTLEQPGRLADALDRSERVDRHLPSDLQVGRPTGAGAAGAAVWKVAAAGANGRGGRDLATRWSRTPER